MRATRPRRVEHTELRSWLVTGCPCLVFHVDTENCIDVWVVLHDRQDFPEWMRET